MVGKMSLKKNCGDSYRLRRRSREIGVAETGFINKTNSQPLSRYLRTNANERERTRMREIKTAFRKLQMSLPEARGVEFLKLTKYNILMLTIAYVDILLEELGNLTDVASLKELQNKWSTKHIQLIRNEPSICCRSNSSRSSTAKLCHLDFSASATAVSRRFVYNPPQSVTSIKKKKGEKQAIRAADLNLATRNLHTVRKAAPSKARGQSRARGRVCRTSSTPTANGAYITLRNCAVQTPLSGAERGNNQPMIFNMVLKKSSIEPVISRRPLMMKKFEPTLCYSSGDLSPGVNNLHNNLKRCVKISSNLSDNSLMVIEPSLIEESTQLHRGSAMINQVNNDSRSNSEAGISPLSNVVTSQSPSSCGSANQMLTPSTSAEDYVLRLAELLNCKSESPPRSSTTMFHNNTWDVEYTSNILETSENNETSDSCPSACSDDSVLLPEYPDLNFLF